MTHFAYPNVARGKFLGCGRYLALDASEKGYETAVPYVSDISELKEAALLLAPEHDNSAKKVCEIKDDPEKAYMGDSQDLAYLLALISCSRDLSIETQRDVWCTGTIASGHSGPRLKHVQPQGFDIKLQTFLAEDQVDSLFFVPAANLQDLHKNWCEEASVEIFTLTQFQSLPPERISTQKMLVKVLPSQLTQLVDCVFHSSTVLLPDSPYRGLFAFQEEDADLFFGREAYVEQLTEALQRMPMLAVIGASGSGKSSVVAAGVIPELRGQGDWQVVSFRPDRNPFRALAASVLSLSAPSLKETERLLEIKTLTAHLESGDLSIDEVVQGIYDANPKTRLLFFIDQFEEIYTHNDEGNCRRFLDELLSCFWSDDAQHPHRLIFTMRADFLGKALAHRSFADVLQHASIMLGPMNREELRSAIEEPARHCGVVIENGLTDKIIEAVNDEPGHLPLLQFALTKLWETQTGHTLTLAAYKAIGGVRSALADYAEEQYRVLSEKEQRQAIRIFTQLVRPGGAGEGTGDTRRVATRSEIGEDGWRLVMRLADARLVVTNQRARNHGDIQDPEETVEVVHEALINGWERLRSWIGADREFLTWRAHLRVEVNAWLKHQKEHGRLLQGTLLAEADDWLKTRAEDFQQDEQMFIRASLGARQRRRHWKKGAVAAALSTAIALAVVFALLWGKAEKQHRFAIELKKQAEEQQRIAERKSIEALSVSAKILFLSRKGLGAMLAIVKAGKILQHADISDSLRAGVLQTFQEIVKGSHRERLRLNVQAPAIAVALKPDDTLLAAGNERGEISLWKLENGEQIAIVSGHDGMTLSLDIHPEGELLASGGADAKVKVWNLRDMTERFSLNAHADAVYQTTFSPGGELLASAGEDATIRLWNVTDGTLLHTLNGHSAAVSSFCFSPNGELLASGSYDGTIKLWNVREARETKTWQSFSASVHSVAFSPDGMLLVSGSDDGTLRLWNVGRGEKITTLSGHSKAVSRVAFSPDGLTIASAGNDKTMKLWSVESGKELHTLQGHTDAVYDLRFSPRGNMLASAAWDGSVRLWELETQMPETLELETLLQSGCEWMQPYLHTHPDLNDADRAVCDDILQ